MQSLLAVHLCSIGSLDQQTAMLPLFCLSQWGLAKRGVRVDCNGMLFQWKGGEYTINVFLGG